MSDKPTSTSTAAEAQPETRRGGGVNVTLVILGLLAVGGVIVSLMMGTQTFEVAGVTTPTVVPFLWYMFVGFIFTTIGAAGGNLAAVGHISVLGMQNANIIKPMSQITTLVTPFFSVPTYLRQRRLVVQLGVLLGVGSIIGSTSGAWVSTNYLSDLATYKPVLGIIVLFVGFRAIYETSRRYRRHKQAMAESSARFERAAREAREGAREEGVRTVEMRPGRVTISFFGEQFGFNPLWPLLGGIGITFIAALLGVGGGFLLVPFMASLLGMPMFVVAGTSLFVIMIGSIVSVSTYLGLGSALDVPLLTIEIVAMIIGALAGPILSKYFKERWLRLAMGLILLYIGVGYVFGGVIESATGIKII